MNYQMTIDDNKRNIRLTAKKNGLGFVSGISEYCSEDYTIENVCSVYKMSPIRIMQEIEEHGMYKIWAHMKIPCRKRPVSIHIGFDKYGKFYTWDVNWGRGYIPKKYKEEMFNILCKWAMNDGWLEVVNNGNDD